MTQNIHAICEECNEAITNPVCPDCLEKEVIAWLRERQREDLILKINDRMSLLKKQSRESECKVKCIICKTDFGICSHCTSRQLLKVFQREKRLINNFLTLFSYVY